MTRVHVEENNRTDPYVSLQLLFGGVDSIPPSHTECLKMYLKSKMIEPLSLDYNDQNVEDVKFKLTPKGLDFLDSLFDPLG